MDAENPITALDGAPSEPSGHSIEGGECQICGATVGDIAEGFADTCERPTNPRHRLIMSLRRTQRRRQKEIDWFISQNHPIPRYLSGSMETLADFIKSLEDAPPPSKEES
jgi:hypothetical protein